MSAYLICVMVRNPDESTHSTRKVCIVADNLEMAKREAISVVLANGLIATEMWLVLTTNTSVDNSTWDFEGNKVKVDAIAHAPQGDFNADF